MSRSLRLTQRQLMVKQLAGTLVADPLKVKSKRQHPEDDEQMALFEWVNLYKLRIPELDDLFHIPNGGTRNPIEAKRFKQLGVKPGVSDLLLPVCRTIDSLILQYCGLWIEMKAQGKYLNPNQRDFQDRMTIRGYKCVVCRSWQEAAREICKYLGKPEIGL